LTSSGCSSPIILRYSCSIFGASSFGSSCSIFGASSFGSSCSIFGASSFGSSCSIYGGNTKIAVTPTMEAIIMPMIM
jgi:hypothetical protein